MGEEQKLVAVISPWEKLSDLIKRKFRWKAYVGEKGHGLERRPSNQGRPGSGVDQKFGITSMEIRSNRVVGKWQDVQ